MGITINQERYLEVLARHLPKPIESDEDYDRWAEVLEGIDLSANATGEERMLSALMKPMIAGKILSSMRSIRWGA